MKNNIENYTKKERPSGGGWSGRVYCKDGKIYWVDYELYCRSAIYLIDKNTNNLLSIVAPCFLFSYFVFVFTILHP